MRTVNFAGLPTPNTESRPSKLQSSEPSILASPFSGARGNSGLDSGLVEISYFPPKGRALVVEGVSSTVSHLAVASLFSRRNLGSIQGPYLSELKSLGKFIVAFTDLRDTQRALEKVQLTHPEWRATPLLARECAQESKGLIGSISDFEGQISIKVIIHGHLSDIDLSQVNSLVQGLVKGFGALVSFKALFLPAGNIKEFVAEFCDTIDAANAVAVLNGAIIEDLEFEAKHVRPDVPSTSGSLLQQFMNPRGHISPKISPSYKIGGCARDHSYVLSPTGRSIIPMEEICDMMEMLSPVQKISSLDSIHQHSDGRLSDLRPKHPQNIVDVNRIRLGQDVRTTIMLRNIPNKVDLSLLKAIVDETSFGKYDFMYLRIDFANNCNVGYAFINFEDFVEARAGHTWNCFNSDKVAEVSYATIQGRECLIQKFRNSSVMLEDPSFRPKLFYTGTGPLAGTEEPFPGPNNMSKMRRSVENAEQVGLFAPRMSREGRRGQSIRPDLPTPHRHRASPPHRQGLSGMDPMASPLALRRGT
ncbi:meiosis protein MEI2, putative [Talaromyces stipitatus ATCC 10500]|uniref:Meiosis protein MEI2, putative n=1 Tax=Talaromyces stipitatus (strain ATCC 10500 / CBS 375.48 / QM 6759 / NRRL 1006) TaxID=441959 RepID=B8MTR3_TALSN|nr:meiosis protein MEI2, putative [Talaromyces stipitatus ATCC 10500]EED12548.1 meiosis protein MEI2, putative [Talaromyces stipitatus ATCC 10500]